MTYRPWQLLLGAALGLTALVPVARSEALSTTSLGLGIRTVTYTQAKSKDVPTEAEEAASSGSGAKAGQTEDTYSDPILCQRISTPSSLGLELGAGGCIHGGGFRTFAHTVSMHVQLIYYPFASRSSIDDDASIRVRRMFFGDLYLVGQGGFAKITHKESQETPVTLTTDVAEFGGGIGWTYRLYDKIAIGAEGFYLVGSILSSATSGSTNMIIASLTVTAFL